MTNVLIADRYAKALSAVIQNDAELDANLAALDALSELLAESDQLHRVLNDPSQRVKERIGILEAILQRLDAPPPAHSAAVVMLRRGRVALLPLMAQLFRRRVDERCNRVAATVTTAMPLTEEQSAPLKHGLEEYVGRDVRLDRRVDESILGGVVAEIAGVIIDGSVRARLQRISRDLIENDDTLLN
jgi:F-type H+-transporting ATPase subunit delta